MISQKLRKRWRKPTRTMCNRSMDCWSARSKNAKHTAIGPTDLHNFKGRGKRKRRQVRLVAPVTSHGIPSTVLKLPYQFTFHNNNVNGVSVQNINPVEYRTRLPYRGRPRLDRGLLDRSQRPCLDRTGWCRCNQCFVIRVLVKKHTKNLDLRAIFWICFYIWFYFNRFSPVFFNGFL